MSENFETISVDIGNGHSMAVDIFGDGTPIVLVHGIPGGPKVWHAVAAELAASNKIIVPHLLGFKDSSKPSRPTALWANAQAQSILKVCAELEIAESALVGHDFGGPITAVLVDLKPEMWTHLALFSTNTFSDTPIPFPLSLAVVPVIGGLFRRLLFSRSSLAMMLRQGVGRSNIVLDPSIYLGDVLQTQSIATIFSYALTNIDTLYQPIERALSNNQKPAIVGWGDKDPFFTTAQGRRTAELVNGAFLLYESAGHFTPEECATEIVVDLRKLLQ